MWLRISSVPVCLHSRAHTFREAVVHKACTGPYSRASGRCRLRLPVCKISRREHVASLVAAKSPGVAAKSRCQRRRRVILCASSASAGLLHSKYDKQILSLAVPALFSIILVRLACKPSMRGMVEAAAEPGRA